ncbi:MAG: class I SAM-dependent methyltransferase [Candidatus Latescibacteria bacterium]|nr:class I SAM-dependent methyltransferase [Candidatus Latescibacterota bacterium]MBT4139591.1 class I SAM-dependent methyltransferase [Candidatus Latescibacterota bacterium]MBT5829862.1 class I SAM-dependent methyltransferase [Candidatus Latescibacterota bacterium]
MAYFIIMPSIYDYPTIYDAIMRGSTDQLDNEINTIDVLLREQGSNNGRILEIGSGTSPHGLPLAQHGHVTVGIDLSDPMLCYAQQAAQSLSIANRYIKANLCNFALEEDPFDCAIFMSETFPLFVEYDDLVNHFACVHRHLKQGGIYVVDVDAHHRGYRHQLKTWGKHQVILPGGFVKVQYEDQPADWMRGINHTAMHCHIQTHDLNIVTEDYWEVRVYSLWTLSVLIQSLNGWQLQGFYSYRDQSENINQDASYYMLLKKT